MKKSLFALMAVAALMFSCQSGEKAPMFVKLSAIPFAIEGTHADLVKGASAEWLFLRDSVANEETDTIYNVTVDAKLSIEKAFDAEKMDTLPQLKLYSQTGEEIIVMDVQDTASIKDFLGYYLKEKVGSVKEIRFMAKISKSKFLQLAQAKQAVLTHFSMFYPEANADPEISKMIDEYEGCCNNAKELLQNGIPAGSSTMMRQFGYVEDCEASLKKKEKLMTPGQLKRYKDISKDIQKEVAKYDF